METIYRYPGEFTDKTISFKGFMYQTKELKRINIFSFALVSFIVLQIQGCLECLLSFQMMLLLKMMTGQRLQEKLVQCITSRSKNHPCCKSNKSKA